MKVIVATALVAATITLTLALPAPLKAQEIKQTPASESLMAIAKEMSESKRAVDVSMQQARSTADANQKTLRDEFALKNSSLVKDLRADKKFGARMAELDVLQKQINGAAEKAQNDYNTNAMPIVQKIQQDSAQIQVLVPIVRRESGLPDSAQFNPETQTWNGLKPAGAAAAVVAPDTAPTPTPTPAPAKK